jgi:hypothetical protein
MVEAEIRPFSQSQLQQLVNNEGKFVIKFVQSAWAQTYATPQRLKISETPALTWGTATYVTPLSFPLSSALYGRVGLVCPYDPTQWRIFDCTRPSAKLAYVNWARAQPSYMDLLLTVHSTFANHLMRNQFREFFNIDCVLFHPDQEAENHTDMSQHIWMAVTDWNIFDGRKVISSSFSDRFNQARFTVLLDEEFKLENNGLPIQRGLRQIEKVTELIHRANPVRPIGVSAARVNPALAQSIVNAYNSNGYLHVYIDP